MKRETLRAKAARLEQENATLREHVNLLNALLASANARMIYPYPTWPYPWKVTTYTPLSTSSNSELISRSPDCSLHS